MRLKCLGTTGYHPSPSRHTACYYLPEQNLLLDAGTGLFRLTAQLLQEPKSELDIILSHAHLDHVAGLTFLLDVMAVTTLKQVRVFARPDKLSVVTEHLFQPLLFPVPPNFELCPLESESGSIRLRNCEIEYFPLSHPGGSIGMRVVSDSRKLAYITDTTPLPQTVADLGPLDLLMHECYFDDSLQELSLRTGHSWMGAVTDIVRACRPKQTLLIHVNPLAEVLGKIPELTEEQAALKMTFAQDDMELAI